jgi:signal transduction histidine kinase
VDLFNLQGHPVVHPYFDPSIDAVPAPLQQAAYRIAAELLHNAVRHAAASDVQVQVLRHPATLEVFIEDNGQGFAPHAPAAGIGLRGVRARVEYLHGHLHVDSSPGGTSVLVRLPC